MTAPTIEHDEAGRRFVTRLDTGDAFLAYEPVGNDTIDLQHTVVPPDERLRGVGDALVRSAVDHARAHKLHIIPSCPFVAAWLKDHPEADDLVAVGG